MKISLIIMLIIFNFNLLQAQSKFGLQYYSTGAGENITLTFSEKTNKTTIGGGVGFNINQIKQPDDQNNIYYKRLYAKKPIHYLNGNFFIQRDLFPKLEKLNTFAFYDLQLKYSTTRSSMFLPFEYDSTSVINEPEEGILYKQYIEYFGPFTWVENGIGIGFNIELTKKFSIQQKFGGGVYFILGYDDQLTSKMFRWFEWEFMYFYNFGISFKL